MVIFEWLDDMVLHVSGIPVHARQSVQMRTTWDVYVLQGTVQWCKCSADFFISVRSILVSESLEIVVVFLFFVFVVLLLFFPPFFHKKISLRHKLAKSAFKTKYM